MVTMGIVPYIAIVIVVLTVIAFIVVRTRTKKIEKRQSTLAKLGMICVVYSCVSFVILSDDSRWVGYSLIGIGLFFIAIDILRRIHT